MQDENRKIEVGDIIRWLVGVDAGYEFEIAVAPQNERDDAVGRIVVYGSKRHFRPIGPATIVAPQTRRYLWEFVDDELTAFVKQVRKEEGIIDG